MGGGAAAGAATCAKEWPAQVSETIRTGSVFTYSPVSKGPETRIRQIIGFVFGVKKESVSSKGNDVSQDVK